jgi:sortase (surface protein transpeptidase)
VQNFSEIISRGLTRYQQEQRQQEQRQQEQRNIQQVLHAKIIEQGNNKISRISKKNKIE